MDQQTHLICETVQYITIDAWPAIYGKDNEHDLDSRDVLEEFRHWGEEFEKWWMSLPEDDREYNLDYQIEVEKFTEKKVKGYLMGFVETLADLVNLLGENFNPDVHWDQLGIDPEDEERKPVKVADLYNHDGLQFNGRCNYALTYVVVYDNGDLEIGAWAWMDDESFDDDAEFHVYDEDDFSASEIQKITDKIKSIYGEQK